MSAGESITSLSEAVAELGALPMPVPVGPEPQADPIAAGRTLDLLELMDERAASVVSPVLAAVLDEAERLRVERDEFCDRVDTLTAVAQGNKRHVVSLTVECQRLTARVAELEAERHSTNEALDDAVQALRVNAEPSPSFAERAAAESDPGRRAAWRMLAQDVADGEHYGLVHHDYRVSHDLPETGGTQ